MDSFWRMYQLVKWIKEKNKADGHELFIWVLSDEDVKNIRINDAELKEEFIGNRGFSEYQLGMVLLEADEEGYISSEPYGQHKLIRITPKGVRFTSTTLGIPLNWFSDFLESIKGFLNLVAITISITALIVAIMKS